MFTRTFHENQLPLFQIYVCGTHTHMYAPEHVTLNLSVLATSDDNYLPEPFDVFQYR